MKLISKFLVIIGLVFLHGCASLSGPAFTEETAVPEGKAVVYVYRPKKFAGGAISYDVKFNGVPYAHLANGGYFPYFAEPGELEISAKTESTSSITLDIVEGQEFFVKGGISIGVFVGRPALTPVENAMAKGEISECKLVAPLASPAAE